MQSASCFGLRPRAGGASTAAALALALVAALPVDVASPLGGRAELEVVATAGAPLPTQP